MPCFLQLFRLEVWICSHDFKLELISQQPLSADIDFPQNCAPPSPVTSQQAIIDFLNDICVVV